jgi:hypothetical protein
LTAPFASEPLPGFCVATDREQLHLRSPEMRHTEVALATEPAAKDVFKQLEDALNRDSAGCGCPLCVSLPGFTPI